MNSAAVDIKDKINGTNGLTFATNLFVGKEPVAPDNCVTVFDVPGQENGIDLDGTNPYEYPNVQVRIRATKYVDGYTLAKNIESLLDGLYNTVINGITYTSIVIGMPATLLDYDENNRVRFIINFKLQRRE